MLRMILLATVSANAYSYINANKRGWIHKSRLRTQIFVSTVDSAKKYVQSSIPIIPIHLSRLHLQRMIQKKERKVHPEEYFILLPNT